MPFFANNDSSLFSVLIIPYIKVEIDARWWKLFNYSNFKLIKKSILKL